MVKRALATRSETYYEVEKILDRKETNGVPLYRIKWKGYPLSASSWEPLENLDTVLDMVQEFDSQKGLPSKPAVPARSQSGGKVVEILAAFENAGSISWRVKLEDGSTQVCGLPQLRNEVPDLVIDYLMANLSFVNRK